MATAITLPQMGAEMEEGKVLSWSVQPGEFVKRGQVIGEIETDKANVDFECFEEGYFLGSVVPLDTTVKVGDVVAYLGAQNEALPADGAAPSAAPTAAAGSASATAQQTPEQMSPPAPATPPVAPAPPLPPQAGPPLPPVAASPAPAAPAAAGAGGELGGNGAGPAPTRFTAPEGGAPAAAPPGGGSAAVPSPGVGVTVPVTAPSGDGVTATLPRGPVLRPDGLRLRVSPVARGLAAQLGIDLAALRGSGPDGRIMRRDVEVAARDRSATTITAAPPLVVPTAEPGAAAPVAPASTPTTAAVPPMPAAPATGAAAVPATPKVAAAAVESAAVQPAAATSEAPALSRMRALIARRMTAAKQQIPHYYVTMSVDMEAALALRKQLNAALSDQDRISVNDLIVKACALAIERYPRFNWSFVDEGLRANSAINIGVAVAVDDGLIVPVVLDCAGRSLGTLARRTHDVVQRARDGRLRPAELTDGTFTISNLGMFGVETLIAIIQPGQSAILGVGKVEARPAVHDGQVVPREMMTLALSADHRVSNGAEGAQFLAEIKRLLEAPLHLAL